MVFIFEAYPALGALRVAMQELGHVGHDRLLVWSLDIDVLGVKEPGDSQLRVSNLEIKRLKEHIYILTMKAVSSRMKFVWCRIDSTSRRPWGKEMSIEA